MEWNGMDKKKIIPGTGKTPAQERNNILELVAHMWRDAMQPLADPLPFRHSVLSKL